MGVARILLSQFIMFIKLCGDETRMGYTLALCLALEPKSYVGDKTHIYHMIKSLLHNGRRITTGIEQENEWRRQIVAEWGNSSCSSD